MPEFESASSFQGRRPGAVFKLGEAGLGYYRDEGPWREHSLEEEAQMRDRRDDEEEKKDAQPSKWAAACDCGSDSRDAMTRGDDENEVSTVM